MKRFKERKGFLSTPLLYFFLFPFSLGKRKGQKRKRKVCFNVVLHFYTEFFHPSPLLLVPLLPKAQRIPRYLWGDFLFIYFFPQSIHVDLLISTLDPWLSFQNKPIATLSLGNVKAH